MPRNGSGVYSIVPGTAAVTNTPISSNSYNSETADLGNEITNSLPTTGVKAMAANLPMGGNKIINMHDGTASSDGATMNNVTLTPGKIIAIQLITSGTTYTRTAGATTGDIFLIGGPGGGGGCPATGAAQFSTGGGGGSGSITAALNVALPATATIAIGAKGTVTVGAAGGNGGTTTFTGGALTLTAPGGNGGNGLGPSGPTFNVNGGAGGSPGTFTGGTFSNFGDEGNPGFCLSGGVQVTRGLGGMSPLWGYSQGGNGNALGPSLAAVAGFQGSSAVIIVIERS